jgi:hypothetical protein
MRQRLRSHLTYANVMVTILAFIVLSGGTALAAYVVSSNSQIGPGTIAGHKPPTGKHANIIAGSINGKDIANQSGVDTCQTPLTGKFGSICAGSDGGARTWRDAIDHCSSYGLRLPTVSEAIALAKNYDVPGVSSGTDFFWTDDLYVNSDFRAATVNEQGVDSEASVTSSRPTVCVTEPSA